MLAARNSAMKTSDHNVTELLKAWEGGNEAALQTLADVVYRDLKRLARYYMANERSGHTLETAL
jgi:hypothetical protein